MKKRILVLALILLFCIVISANAQAYINYAEALQKSIYFYDAEKCGLETPNRLEWRGPCHMEDAAIALTPKTTNLTQAFIDKNKAILDPDGDGFMNLLGGYHDAGDHVQFGLPQGYAASTLGWGLNEFKQAYIDSGNYEHMLEILKYFTDFFIRCSFFDASGNMVAFCYQTGDGSIDHAYWGPPELQDPDSLRDIGQNGVTYARPAWFAYPDKPGSDVCAEAAASLAAMYLNYLDVDEAYAQKCLDTAKALYAFAVKNRGIADSGGYYGSDYDFDEMTWAAAWLYDATKDMSYIDDILEKDEQGNNAGYIKRLISTPGDTWINIWVHCWDAVWGGAFVKLSSLFPENEQLRAWARWNLEFWSGGKIKHEDESMGGGYIGYSPGGFGVINTWGSARYNTAAQLCALIYAKHNNRSDFVEWAKGQMDYIMGDNPLDLSFIVGYGDNYVKHPHHRAAHGSFTNSMVDPVDHRHTLWGALASGPDGNDKHIDLVSEYSYNEVAIDYNAAFVGALAAFYEFYGREAGHKPVPDFPPPESEDVENFELLAQVEREPEGNERSQISLVVSAFPIHKPVPMKGVMVRYFFDISELVEVGQSIDAVHLDIYYDEMSSQFGSSVSHEGPLVWDEENNIYYVEFRWDNRGIIGKRHLQFGLWVTQASDYKTHWDPTNDYSRQGLEIRVDQNVYQKTNLITLYNEGELMLGEEPPGGSGSTATPEAPTPTPVGTFTPPVDVFPGDVDGNEVTNIVDALLVAQYYVGIIDDINTLAADVNCDNNVNIVDALLIAQYYVKLIDTIGC